MLRVGLHASVMLGVALAVWGLEVIDPTACAGMMLLFTWCAYRIGLPKDARGWEEALVGGNNVFDSVR